MDARIIAFPFEQTGRLLRQLSLSGGAGNVLAIIIYVLLSLSPCIAGIWLKKKGSFCRVDYLLFVLSAFLFGVLYYMINPGLFTVPVAGSGKLLLGGSFYSFLLGYLLLRILKKTAEADMSGLQRGLRVMLYVAFVLFAGMIAVELCYSLPAAIRTAGMENGASLLGGIENGASLAGGVEEGASLAVTYFFLAFQSAVNVLPYVLNLYLLSLSIRAVNELLTQPYSDKAVAAVKQVGVRSRQALALAVISGMTFHAAQLLCRNKLSRITVTASFPLFSILFLLAILMVAKYVEENQKLNRDNELFI